MREHFQLKRLNQISTAHERGLIFLKGKYLSRALEDNQQNDNLTY